MKKRLLTLLVFTLLLLTACTKKELLLNKNQIDLKVDQEEMIEARINDKIQDVEYIYESDIIKIENGKVTALKEGSAEVTIQLKSDPKIKATLTVNVSGYDFEIIGASQIIAGEKLQLEINKNYDVTEWKVSNPEIASISNTGLLKANKDGRIVVTAKVGETVVEHNIDIIKPNADQFKIEYKNTMFVGEKNQITVTHNTSYIPEFTTADLEYITISNEGEITALKAGKVKITISIADYQKEVEIEVLSKDITSIELNSKTELEVFEEVILDINILPDYSDSEIQIISSDEDTLTVNNQTIKALKVGVVTLTIEAKDNSNYKIEVEITIKDTMKPEIKIDETLTTKDVKVIYNKPFDPLLGVVAVDNYDNDLTSKINVKGTIDTCSLGTQVLTYYVTDSSGNRSETLIRNITVYWDYPVTFIGHMGSYSGMMNSEDAFIRAVTLHDYQALECDIKQTKDGVFILCHDDDLKNYGHSNVTLANTNYADLKDLVLTQTRGGIKYESKICTLERYLEICKEYNAIPVIELKSSKGINGSDTSRMQALMDVIEASGILNRTILLGSNWHALKWTRENGYKNVTCQYLVSSLESATYLNRCLEYDFDISFSISSENSLEWIRRYQAEGIKVSCYTFSQYTNASDLQKWIDMGVDYVTVDVTKPSDVKIPEYQTLPEKTYKVVFKDDEGNILKERIVPEGYDAVTPVEPEKAGYIFVGWDKDVTNVTQDIEVFAKFELITYKIEFEHNFYQITEAKWASKNDFVNEFYSDYHSWLAENINNIPELTKTNDKYTFTKNGATATWTTPASMLDIDIYVFEKTLSHYIYKPITRVNDEAVEPELDEGYFLNSSKYVIKYRALDGYFLNGILKNYTSYNKEYKPASSGRIQIFFRFHQWCKGTNIPVFNTLPKKYIASGDSLPTGLKMPSDMTYTSADSLTLPTPTCEGKTFIGWFKDVLGTDGPVTKIDKGTSGDLVLYAKWQ